jgi:small Trp-rich protein
MWFLMLGLAGAALKYFEIGPVAGWSWWIVLAPFGLASIWWWFADWSGYTKRKVIERENERKQARIDRQRDNIGLPPQEQKGRRGGTRRR